MGMYIDPVKTRLGRVESMMIPSMSMYAPVVWLKPDQEGLKVICITLIEVVALMKLKPDQEGLKDAMRRQSIAFCFDIC